MQKRKSEYQNTVINRVRALRQNNGITQPQMAEILLISNGQYGNIESNRYSHKFTLKQLVTIANYFKVPIANLFIESPTGHETIEEIINLIIQYNE